jgi:hypothetical protein
LGSFFPKIRCYSLCRSPLGVFFLLSPQCRNPEEEGKREEVEEKGIAGVLEVAVEPRNPDRRRHEAHPGAVEPLFVK